MVNHINISIPAKNTTYVVNFEAYGLMVLYFMKEIGRTGKKDRSLIPFS